MKQRPPRRARLEARARPGRRAAALAIAALLFSAGRAAADDDALRTTYGDVGLLEMPSARMAPDGQLSGTIAMLKGTQRYNFAFQLTPWFEGTFRYSRISHIGGTDVVYDRSFGMKLRFWRETEIWPEVSLGIRDLLGTGVYSSEYVVASKRFGDFDTSIGLGWGRLASVDTFPNPFAQIFPSFKTRSTFTGVGGTVNFGTFFHGPAMGLFGGMIWRSPIENLSVVVEYSSDDYTAERAGGRFAPKIPVNLGVTYRALDTMTLSAGWYYGTSYGITLAFAVDPTRDMSPQRFGAQIPPPIIRPPERQIDALTGLIVKPVPPAKMVASLPFVQLPVPPEQRDSMALSSALMSTTEGVHDVDVAGHTVMIEAHLKRLAGRQCGRLAGMVASIAPELDTVAISDLDDPSGAVSICAVPHGAGFLRVADAAPAPEDAAPAAKPLAPDEDPVLAEKKIREDIAAQSLSVVALSIEPSTIWLYYDNRKYRTETEAVGRIARVLMADAPAKAEIFHIVSASNSIEMRDFRVTRSALERVTLAYGSARELGEALTIAPAPMDNPVLDAAEGELFPKLHWKISPGLRTGFFDPSVPLQVQFLVAVDASVEVTRNLTIEGRVEGNIYNNYDLSRLSNSQLPHVRSDLNLYFKKGINDINNLDAVYRARLAPDVTFEARAGYLEDMFAGGGFQVLWRPENSRFAFGMDLYQVWQRGFTRLFSVQNYNILTGHASVYYDSPWYGLNFAVHGGRYLAGDYGATVEVTREFSTGIQIGAFATFTNVPFSKFGEGSFDKGIIIHIPLQWALPFYSNASYDMRLRSLIRDGGQRLDNDNSLYWETEASSYGEATDTIENVIAP